MSKIKFKPGTMLNPIPAVMVSCRGEVDNIITIGWTGIVNSDPPMTYVSIRKERLSYEIIKKSKEFVINLTTEDLARATDFCGVRSGRSVDKFKEMRLTKEPADQVDCPMIKESPVNIECKVKDIINLGSHHMFLAEIVDVHVEESLMDTKGRLALEKAGLIAYCHGHYVALKDKSLGTFGFSVMKAKTKKRKEKESMKNKRKG